VAPSEPLPTCQRRALWALALSLASLAAGGLGQWLGWGLPDRVNGFFVGMGIGGLFAAALLWFTPDMSDAVPKKLARRYQRDVAVAMSLYIAIMLFWKRLLDLVDATWLRVLIALAPALLVCWVLRAFVIYVRDSDEMQRRLELESVAIAAMLMSAIYLAAGFLQSADLIAVPAKVAMLWVFPSLCLLYGVTKVFVSRRYL
jgi:MFS family permease